MKTALMLAFLTLSTSSFAEVMPKSAAPDFTLKDMKGVEQKLSNFKGKWVVLEWFNKDCPFVLKHYRSNNMQNLQKNYTSKGVVWLTMYSSAKGTQGHEEGAGALKTQEAFKGSSSFLLDDSKGDIGRLYGAKTTPHMYIINPEQVVVYQGAIDSNSSFDAADIPKSTNYVSAALDAGMKGSAVAVAHVKPYGCAVKY